jgi:restriction system protein
VQCKFYTKPVSNKAVQEVAAARLHEGADQAVVVSNAAYTKSARQLAGTTGVLLLHHDDLASFDGQRKSSEVAK